MRGDASFICTRRRLYEGVRSAAGDSGSGMMPVSYTHLVFPIKKAAEFPQPCVFVRSHRLDQAVVSVGAFIDYVNLVIVRIAEYIKVVAQKLQLHGSVFLVHRAQSKFFVPHDPVSYTHLIG